MNDPPFILLSQVAGIPPIETKLQYLFTTTSPPFLNSNWIPLTKSDLLLTLCYSPFEFIDIFDKKQRLYIKVKK